MKVEDNLNVDEIVIAELEIKSNGKELVNQQTCIRSVD